MILHETPEPGTAGVHRIDAQPLELIVCCAGEVGKDIVAIGAESQHGTLCIRKEYGYRYYSVRRDSPRSLITSHKRSALERFPHSFPEAPSSLLPSSLLNSPAHPVCSV
jgi:hypothetical protein